VADSQRTRIQNFLQATAAAYSFPTITYDDITSNATVQDAAEDTIKPSSCKANEVGSSFERDENQGRRVLRQRNEWRFELWLKFTKEVLMEGFENSLIDPVKRMSPTADHLGVLLELDASTPVHPAQQEAKAGTEARLIFIATEMRR